MIDKDKYPTILYSHTEPTRFHKSTSPKLRKIEEGTRERLVEASAEPFACAISTRGAQVTSITYRTTGPWGLGQGSDLSAAQIDANFYTLYGLYESLFGHIPAGEIDYFNVVGNVFYVHLTNHVVLGPYDLPQWMPTFVGSWQPNTSYGVDTSFYFNGSIYIVIFFGYTSGATFNPNANDGLGNNYLSLVLACPGNVLPNGGSVGDVLTVLAAGTMGSPPTTVWGPSNATPGWTAALNTTAPNGVVNASTFTASDGTFNQDAVIRPAGGGAFSLLLPDGAAGGNKRGSGAVDLQLSLGDTHFFNAGDEEGFFLDGPDPTAVASGVNAYAEGVGTTSSGFASHAEGYLTIASGDYSHAEGGPDVANNVHAPIASGVGAHAEGIGTVASGAGSHAEGFPAGSLPVSQSPFNIFDAPTATNYGSHAEGVCTVSSGIASHAEGFFCVADGDFSQATGFYSYTKGVRGFQSYGTSQFENASGSGTNQQVGRLIVSGLTKASTPLSPPLLLSSDGGNFFVASPVPSLTTTYAPLDQGYGTTLFQVRVIANRRNSIHDFAYWIFDKVFVSVDTSVLFPGPTFGSCSIINGDTADSHYASAGASSWTATVVIVPFGPEANGALTVEVTGDSGADIFWVAEIKGIELMTDTLAESPPT